MREEPEQEEAQILANHYEKPVQAIDSAEVKGEPGTGYEGPGKGPFQCSNCEYFNGTCGQKTMMQRSRLPKTPNGRVKTDPRGCCEYIDRKGTKESAHGSDSRQA